MVDNKFAVVFPGQGSQHIEMLSGLANIHTEIKQYYALASEVIDCDLWRLCQEGPLEKLNTTEFTQPVLLTASYALWQIFCKLYDDVPSVMAGHSLGEYSALVAADSINFQDAVKLVSDRGKFMQDAVPLGRGAMAAVLGLEPEDIQAILDTINSDNVVEIANLNANGQTVIAGEADAVNCAVEKLKEGGAKLVKVLDVSVPSHCSLMHSAEQKLSNALDKIEIKAPKIDIIHNYSLESYDNPQDIKLALSKQLVSPVRWVETVNKINKMGVDTLYELGPGSVLSKLCKRINKNVKCLPVNDIESLESIIHVH